MSKRPTTSASKKGPAEEQYFAVESIVDKRKKGRKTEYLVSWAGHGQEANSWEPEAQLLEDIPAVVHCFNAMIERTTRGNEENTEQASGKLRSILKVQDERSDEPDNIPFRKSRSTRAKSTAVANIEEDGLPSRKFRSRAKSTAEPLEEEMLPSRKSRSKAKSKADARENEISSGKSRSRTKSMSETSEEEMRPSKRSRAKSMLGAKLEEVPSTESTPTATSSAGSWVLETCTTSRRTIANQVSIVGSSVEQMPSRRTRAMETSQGGSSMASQRNEKSPPRVSTRRGNKVADQTQSASETRSRSKSRNASRKTRAK